MNDTYENILNDLKHESQLQNYVCNFWNIFEDYDYKYPNFANHLISVIDNKCSSNTRTMLYKLSIYFDLFYKCIELNLNIVNEIDKSNSVDQLMVLNLMSIIISKINNLCYTKDNSEQMTQMLQNISEQISINNYLDLSFEKQIKKLNITMTQCLCNFIFYFI